jgi:hypothetical protein
MKVPGSAPNITADKNTGERVLRISTINIPTVPHLDHENDQHGIFNLAE